MDERSESSSQGTTEQAEVASSASLPLFAPSVVWATKGRRLATLVAPRVWNRATSATTWTARTTIEMFAFFMRTGRHVLILGRIELPDIKAFPKVLPEALESEMDLRHWFDGYEDRKRR